ncbi:MAG: YggT family protein [Alphaproteobacteria bacterium]|nr:YggT family protein [Alphaproteobacteria bacterium]
MRELLFALHGYIFAPIIWLIVMVIIAYFVMSWLFVLGIVQQHNPTARQVYGFLHSIVEPMARPIRRILPPMGGLDLSPLVLILGLQFLSGYGIPKFISLIPF